jgi:ferredoxin-NADP reductase
MFPMKRAASGEGFQMGSSHEVEFLGIETCGSDVVSARFSRPPEFQFAAGQWIVLALTAGETRLAETFTICSAPSDDFLEITTRLSGSPYKNALAGLVLGDRAALTGPGGHLAIPADATRVAFLVGGVGITPVHSMLRQAAAQGRVFDDALLFYGNRDQSCVPFEAEFAAMADSGVRTVLCFERASDSWKGDRGFISAQMVRRYLPPTQTSRPFIVAGPPIMVEAMERVLDELGVPESDRLVEHFGPRPIASRHRATEGASG